VEKQSQNKANFKAGVFGFIKGALDFLKNLIFQLGLKKAEKNVSHYKLKVLWF